MTKEGSPFPGGRLMRRFGGRASQIMLATAVAALVAGADCRRARAGSTTVLIPAYFYPGGSGRAFWDQIAAGAGSIAVEAILNPSTGPGKAQDPNYVAVVD